MLIESGDLIPVKKDAVDIPWTKRKTQIINCLHKGPVSFKTFVYDTNVGDIAPVSTYFNPNKWTEHDLNFKFGITMNENSLNINSTGNSSASSTSESMFSSTSNFKRLTKDGCEEQIMFRTNSLQPRLVLISEDDIRSGNSKNSCKELNSENTKPEVKYADPQIVLNKGPQLTVMQNRILNKSESLQNTKRCISMSSPNFNQLERTKEWVCTSFVDQKENIYGSRGQAESVSEKPYLFSKVESNNTSNEGNSNNVIHDCATKSKRIQNPEALHFHDNEYHNPPNITFSTADDRTLVENEIKRKNDTSLNYSITHDKFARINKQFDRNVEGKHIKDTETVNDVLSRYGIKKRSSSISDVEGRKQIADKGLIGPPKMHGDFNRRPHSETQYFPKKIDYSVRRESISPINSFDDVFNDQNEQLVTLNRQPLNSTQNGETMLDTQAINAVINGHQCQHEHWDSTSFDMQTNLNDYKGNKIMATKHTEPPFWKNVENSRSNNYPCFLSPWTKNFQNAVAFSCDISPTSSLEDQEQYGSGQTRNNSPSDLHVVGSNSFMKSALVSNETSPGSDGNNSSENLPKQSHNTSKDVKPQNQFECRYLLSTETNLIGTKSITAGDEFSSLKRDRSRSKENSMENAYQGKDFSNRSLSPYYGCGQDLTSVFGQSRRSDLSNIWTPREFHQQVGKSNHSPIITPDNFNDNGVEKGINGKCYPRVNKTKVDDNNDLHQDSSLSEIDPEHLVRGLRKLAGENFP